MNEVTAVKEAHGNDKVLSFHPAGWALSPRLTPTQTLVGEGRAVPPQNVVAFTAASNPALFRKQMAWGNWDSKYRGAGF